MVVDWSDNPLHGLWFSLLATPSIAVDQAKNTIDSSVVFLAHVFLGYRCEDVRLRDLFSA